LSLSWLIKTMRSKSEWAQKVYAEAGAVAEETLGQMRTIASLNAEKKALKKYNDHTRRAEAENIKLAKYTSGVFAMFLASMWVMYSIGLWYGGHKVSIGKTSPTEVFQAFFGILMGSGSLAQISPNLTAVAMAAGSAQALFEILDTKSEVDASKDDGLIPEKCDGAIEVKNVNFTYPTRSEAPVLMDYNLSIRAGETVAFVGSSGGGKSTLVSLLERFYDPQSGSITLDGVDIKELNVRWLRQQIGIVQQEPVLFQTSIYENIAAGGKDVTASH
jgi:ABC-type multidrug transport system fused ATPase/permease subunit